MAIYKRPRINLVPVKKTLACVSSKSISIQHSVKASSQATLKLAISINIFTY